MKPPFRAVLCPSDLSATGDAAVALACALMAPDGVLHLLHIWEPAYVMSPLDATPVVPLPTSPEKEAEHERHAADHLRGAVPSGALPEGARVETHVLRVSGAAATIRAEGERLHVDAIVIGSHGRSGIGRLLMGSVATDVLKGAKIPVILVRDPAAK
jgi:nucleotide-binding universal stress UspA family protein